MKKVFIILTLFFLVSCATEAGYQRALDSYIGVSEKELVGLLYMIIFNIDSWGG